MREFGEHGLRVVREIDLFDHPLQHERVGFALGDERVRVERGEVLRVADLSDQTT